MNNQTATLMAGGGNVSSTTWIPIDLVVPMIIIMIWSKSSLCKSLSISFLILATSYKYFTLTLPISFCWGLSVPFGIPAALLINQEVGGGLTMKLKDLSTKARSLTLHGTSGLIWPVLSLNYLQNSIMFIPWGPSAWPSLGLGFAAPPRQ